MTRAAAFGVLLGTLGFGLWAATGAQWPGAADTGPPVVQQRWKRDAAYLAAVDARGVHGSDAELLATARAVCADIDRGASLEAVVADVQARHPVSLVDAAFVAGAAVRTQCPRHVAVVGG